MKKYLILAIMFFTIFLDMFNLGLIYPIFTSLVFENNGHLIGVDVSEFYKNALFGLLIALFPFGQFLGAPVIGQLSDQYGRRKLLIFSLVGTVATLFMCACGVYFSSLLILLLGRFVGGLMAGNLTLAYASLADFSTAKDKVKNFALIPFVTGVGFALGPYLAGILADPQTHSWSGPALPFLFATFLSVINLILVIWKFPETAVANATDKVWQRALSNVTKLWHAFSHLSLRIYLTILFLMLASNLLFVQFVGPFAIDRLQLSVVEIGYLYVNIGIAVALGHLFLARGLAAHFSSEKVLTFSLLALSFLLMALLLTSSNVSLHVLTFFIMLACAVAYTNIMALISNKASKEQQGEIMGIAVSVQSCAEFLPALILGLTASASQAIPLLGASLCALLACSLVKLCKEGLVVDL